jgi:hypothetical protein
VLVKPGSFYMFPKHLRGWLEDGTITPTEFGLIGYLGCAGADYDGEGVATTYAALRAIFRCSEKTITRSLQRLRDLDAVRYELRQGQRHPFRITLGPAARVRSELGADPMYEVESDHTSDVTSPPITLDPASAHAETSVTAPPNTAQTET